MRILASGFLAFEIFINFMKKLLVFSEQKPSSLSLNNLAILSVKIITSVEGVDFSLLHFKMSLVIQMEKTGSFAKRDFSGMKCFVGGIVFSGTYPPLASEASKK